VDWIVEGLGNGERTGIDPDSSLASDIGTHDLHGRYAASGDDDILTCFDATNGLGEIRTNPGDGYELHGAIVKNLEARFKGYVRRMANVRSMVFSVASGCDTLTSKGGPWAHLENCSTSRHTR